MLEAVADYHADKACEAYQAHQRLSLRGDEEGAERALSIYARHILIADHFRKGVA